MLSKSLHSVEKSFMKWRVNQCGKLHCYLILRNCHSYPNLQQLLSWSLSSHQHQGRALHEQKDYNSLEAQIGEGNGNPLQCSCLENPRDRGAWWAAVYGVTQSRTQLTWLSSGSSKPTSWWDLENKIWWYCYWDPEEVRPRRGKKGETMQALNSIWGL